MRKAPETQRIFLKVSKKNDLSKWICGVVAVAMGCSVLSAAAGSFDDKLARASMFGQDDGRYGQLKTNLRLRYETVDEDDVPKDPAKATTLRLRLGYLTPEASDLLVSKKFGKHYVLLAKYAYYDADQFSTDTQKLWLQAEANF